MSVKNAKNDQTGDVEEMVRPMYLQIAKSRPEYVYPLEYEQDFAWSAKETVIDESSFGCQADLNDYSPTCGWQYDSNKNKIWHSQGFCCECSIGELLQINTGFLRGTKCEFLQLSAGASSAHCLRF